MTERQRLPNRRACETFDFESQGLKFTASFSRGADGTVQEIFMRNHKAQAWRASTRLTPVLFGPSRANTAFRLTCCAKP